MVGNRVIRGLLTGVGRVEAGPNYRVVERRGEICTVAGYGQACDKRLRPLSEPRLQHHDRLHGEKVLESGVRV